MTRRPRERDRYVAKVNSLVAAGRDDLVEEITSQYKETESSGREAFWAKETPGWPTRRS
ncbi:MAG: hypothetical protein M3N95_15215 [Actinomycetota bacterium]|nr:hypothetical protein [Actinomycetota bacterium]